VLPSIGYSTEAHTGLFEVRRFLKLPKKNHREAVHTNTGRIVALQNRKFSANRR